MPRTNRDLPMPTHEQKGQSNRMYNPKKPVCEEYRTVLAMQAISTELEFIFYAISQIMSQVESHQT
jgi:hypothetical protein